MSTEDFTRIGRVLISVLFLLIFVTAGPVLISAPSTISVLFGAFLTLICIAGITLCSTRTFNPILKVIYDFLNLKKGN